MYIFMFGSAFPLAMSCLYVSAHSCPFSPLPPSLRLFLLYGAMCIFFVRVAFLRGHHCDAQVPSTREVKVNWVRPGTVVHESEQVLFIFTHLNNVKDTRFKLQRYEDL